MPVFGYREKCFSWHLQSFVHNIVFHLQLHHAAARFVCDSALLVNTLRLSFEVFCTMMLLSTVVLLLPVWHTVSAVTHPRLTEPLKVVSDFSHSWFSPKFSLRLFIIVYFVYNVMFQSFPNWWQGPFRALPNRYLLDFQSLLKCWGIIHLWIEIRWIQGL